MKLTCDMKDDCSNQVTHIGEKGYVYCGACAPERRGWERVRRMHQWELRLLQRGEPVPSYRPITQREYLESKRQEYLAKEADAQGVIDDLNHATQ